MTFTDGPSRRGGNLCIPKIDVSNDDSRLFRLNVSSVHCVFRVESSSLSLCRFEHSTTACERTLCTGQVRLASRQRSREAIRIGNRLFQLLVGGGLCGQERLLAFAFRLRPIDIGLNGGHTGLCSIHGCDSLNNCCLRALNLSVLNPLGRLIVL